VPFNLTTGVSTETSTDLSQSRVFCGFCANAVGSFAIPALPCANDSFCSGIYPICKQRSAGAFGVTDARTITQTGEPPPSCLSSDARKARLVGTFCVPPSTHDLVNAVLDLPGPGSVALSVGELLGP
jgi:hypothetical protein